MAQATGRATPARDERGQRGSETSARRPDARRKLSARETTGRATEAVGARDDRRRYGSCRRVRRPAALRKLSARETIAETSRRSETSSAEAAGRARSQRFCATSASRSESVIRGGARGASARGESQTLGGARYERREGVRGRPNAAGRLAQKLPSPALKEAERSGSYNPSDLNTLTGGTVRSGTVQGQQREEQRTPCPVNLRGPERTRSGEARRVRDTDQGQESVLRRD